MQTNRTADLISLDAFDDDKCRNDERTMSTGMTKSVRSRGTPKASWDTTSDVNKTTCCSHVPGMSNLTMHPGMHLKVRSLPHPFAVLQEIFNDVNVACNNILPIQNTCS